MMREEEAVALLDLLMDAYPNQPVNEGTCDLYVEAMMQSQWSHQIVADAVRVWILNEAWFPKVNELLDGIQSEGRQVRREERAQYALPPGAPALALLPKTVVHTHLGIVRDALRAFPPMDHDHHQGRAGCAACNAAEERAAKIADLCDEMVAQHPEMTMTVGVETYRCTRCHDHVWIEEGGDDLYQFVIPCMECQPELYERWRAKHFDPNHDCDDCRSLIRGKRR